MKRILITGFTGFVGRRAAVYLSTDHEVFTPSHAEMDITSQSSVTACLSALRPDLILNFAGQSDIGRCAADPALSWQMNVIGCMHLARAAAEEGIKMISCSSDQVYTGLSSVAPHSEDESLAPTNLYAWEKLSAETECLRLNPDCVFLRLAWMYDLSSASPAEHGDLMRDLLYAIRAGNARRYSRCDYRGITYVYDVITNLEKATALPGGTYNFGSPNDRSMYETVLAAVDNAGISASFVEADEGADPRRMRNIRMDQAKLNSFGITFPNTTERLSSLLKQALEA